MATTIAKDAEGATAVTHAARIEHVSKSFPAPGTPGGQQLVLDDITLDVAPGEFVTLLGASGCGKSTLLNLVAGLDLPSVGSIDTDGRPALMFQEHALFPWLTAGKNIELALKLRGVAGPERRQEAERLLELVRLQGAYGKRVHELSGGMRAGLEAGLDALESVQAARTPLRETLIRKALPPITAVALVLVIWQLLVWAEVASDYKLPAPSAVWDEVTDAWLQGTLLDSIWTSVSRGLLGFLMALAIGTPLGLLVSRVKFVRAAIGPILSGLQSLPSVAWVPPAVLWLGLNNSMMYAVILLGAVPSIANGLVAGIDQIPPLFLRAGRTLGATGLRGAWRIVMPGALPGYLAGLKQGWAFSWRSLMAAEIIASSPDLGVGLGQLLENGRNNASMSQVFLAIFLILLVGIAIDLLIFSPLERRVLHNRGLLVTH